MNPTDSRVRAVLAMAVIGFVLVALVIAGFALFLFQRLRDEERTSEEKRRAAVLKVLNDQVDAWNRGDLDGFMSGYWRSEDLTFFSGGNVRHGWDETFSRYRTTYRTDRKDMAVAHLVAQTLAAQGLATGAPTGALAQQLAALGVWEADLFTPEMGTLTFDELQVTPTGANSAVVRGRWALKFEKWPPVGGLFTLLFREETQGWCIVHDHTSK